MKRFLLLLTLLCTLFSAVNANEVTISDGTSTSSYVPAYGLYADTQGSRSQCLYPADSLTDLTNGSISKMTFYLSSPATDAWTGTFVVSLGTTSESSLTSGFISDDDLTAVYTGLVDATGSTMEIEFESPFTYTGDNLVVDFYVSVAGNYKSAYFYGSPLTGAGRYRNNGTAAGTAVAVLPKVTFEFTTSGGGPTCERPSNLAITDLAAHQMTLNWEGGRDRYNVGYKGPNDDDYVYPAKKISATSYTITGLESNTSYTVCVQSVCGEDVSSIRSKTVKTAIAIPYEENFDDKTAVPSDWKRYSGLYDETNQSATRTSTTSGWTFLSGTTGVFASKHMYCTIGYSTYQYWLEMPAIQMDENAQLTFLMALSKGTAAYTEIVPGSQADDKFIVLASVDEGETWAILRKWDNAGSEYVFDNIALYGEEVNIDLSAYANQNVIIAFYGESTQAGGTNYLHIDDVVVDYGRACSKPAGLAEVPGKASKTSVQLAWNEDANASAWKVQYKKKGSSDDWATVSAAENPFTLTGLDAYTEYLVRVAALCDATDESSLTRYCKEITVKTAAGVPYAESFNASSLPADWKRYEALWASVQNGGELSSVAAGWSAKSKANANNVFDSAYHVMLNIAGEDCKYWLVSPAIEMEAGYELSFDLALTKSDGGAVAAGGQEDDMFAVLVNENGEWNEVAVWSSTGAGYAYDEINGTTSGEVVKIDLSSYAGKNIQIAFYGESTVANGNNNLHISNVAIGLIPACAPALSLYFDNVEDTTATAIWTASEDGTWEYGFKANPAEGFVPADADYTHTTQAKTVVLNGLAANTQHMFFLRRVCEGGKSDPLIRSFKTFPAPKTAPWSENFTTLAADMVPDGWDNSASSTPKLSTNPEYVWGVYEYEGNKMIRMYNYYVTAGTALINTPRIVMPSDQAYILSFDYAHTATCGKFSVRISNDGGSSWTELGQYDKTSTGTDKDNPGEFTTAEINLTSYMGQKIMIQFFSNANYGSGAIFVDNIDIHAAPECLKPTGLDISSVEAEKALAAWNDDNDGNTWVYACVEATAAEPEGAAMTPVAQNSLQLTGLTEKTNYIFYLRKKCGEDYSESISMPFRTIANPIAVPWSENFEAMEAETVPEEWDNSASTSTTLTSYPERVWGVYEYEGNKMIRMYNYYVSSGTALINTPRIALPASPAYELSFDYAHTATCGNILVKISADGGANWEQLGSYGKTSTGTDKDNPGEFSKIELNLSAYAGETILLQFFANANYGSGAVFVDNIDIHELPSCLKPTELAVVDNTITTNSVGLEWLGGADESYWFMQYKKSADTVWMFVADSVKAHPFTLQGLEPASVYDVRVAAWCNTADSADASMFSNPISFITECEALTAFPYEQGFDSLAGVTSGHLLPICWDYINTCTNNTYNYYPTVYKGSSYANTPDNSLKFYSYYYPSTTTDYDPQDQYAILPEMEGVSGLRIKFNARKYSASYDATFYVGVLSDPADTATFVIIDTIAPAAAMYESFVIPFSSYTAGGKFIAFKMEHAEIGTSSSYRGVYIDDIVVEEIPSCLEPTGLTVIADSLTMSSAAFTWTAQGPEEAWILQYKQHSADEWISVAATADTISVSGLSAATRYDVRVAAQCNETEVSPFTGVSSFVTACGAWSIEERGAYAEGFEGYEGAAYSATTGVVPNCWEAVTDGSVAPHIVAAGGSYAYVHDGENALSFYGSGNCYAALPEFVEDLSALRISFWMQTESATNGTLTLGYITAENPSIFHEIVSYANNNGSLVQRTTDLTAVPDSAARLVFRWYYSSQWSCCIDDIEVSLIPSCLNPTDLAAELTPGNGEIASIYWKAANDETAWVLEYARHEDFSDAVAVDATDTIVAIQGLMSDSLYYARVKAVCGAGSESAWSQTISFRPTNDLSLILNDSTATNAYVPFYGLYVDNLTHSQFIIPEADLTSLMWGSIKQLTFFATAPLNETFNGVRFEVYMAEAPATTLSAYADFASMTKVMNASAVAMEDGKMVITLDEPYTYAGGNLMIGFDQTVSGSYKSTTWLGKTVTGASVSSYGTAAATQRNFLPKMKISYTAGQAPACMYVKDLQISGITASSATISWTNGAESQNAWQLAYSADPEFDLAQAVPVDASSNPFVLAELLTDTSYVVYVRANCGEDGFSAWSKAATFHTASACQLPDELAVADITAASASISWNTYGQSGFNFRYSQDGTNWLDTVENISSPYNFSNLADGMDYYIQVQVACNTEAWSEALYFQTKQLPAALPYANDFETVNGWAFINGELTNAWAYGEAANNTADGSHALYISSNGGASNNYSNTKKAQVFATKLFQFEDGIYNFQYDWKANGEGNYDVLCVGLVPADSVLEAKEVTGTFSVPAGWTLLHDGNKLNLQTAWQSVSKDVAVEAGLYKMVLLWRNDASGGTNPPAAVDNIRIKKLTCLKPLNAAVSDVFAHSAKLSWKAGAEGQAAWQIALDTIASFDPDTLSNLIDANDSVFVLSNLDPSTNYYAYVRTNCGEEDGYSMWAGKISFTTTIACPAPQGLAAELTPGNGSIATLTWIAAEASAWTVEYSLNEDMSDSIVVNVTEAAVNLTGLTAEATYYARIKADCGDLDGESEYSAVFSFIPTDKYEMTVNDGTATNSYVPVYGMYVDEATRSQFIIPEDDLETLEWDSIKSLTFYASQANVNWGDARFEVYVAEAPEATMDALTDWSNMTLVRAADSLIIADNKMVVVFDEAYQYQGGHLMIGFYQTVSGTYKSATWYGVSAQGASFGGNGDGNAVQQRNFLPKLTIEYVPGVAPACPNPKHLAVADISAHAATASWKAVEGAAWQYALQLAEAPAAPQDADFINVEEGQNSVALENLQEMTDYVFYLRRFCGEDGYSEIVSVAFSTEAHIEHAPFADDFEGANYWKLVNDQANAWAVGDAVAYAGDKALYISNDGGLSNAYTFDAQSASYATLLIHLDKDTTYEFQYEWKCNGEFFEEDGALDYMRVGLVPAASEIVAGATSLPAGWIDLDGGEALLEATEWQHVSVDTALNAGMYKVVVAWFNDEADGNNPAAAFDNFSISYKDSQPTRLNEGLAGSDKAVKFIKNNHVYILVNGAIYDATGRRVE